MYTNAQSVVGKVNELACTVGDVDPDLILVTETWCNSEITDAYLTIPGYEVQSDLRVDRENTGGGRGGGLLVYVKIGLQVLKLDHEATFCQICKFSVSDMIFYLLYRPPSAGPDSISEIAAVVSGAGKNSVIIGDFNVPDIDWMGGVARGRASELLEAVEEKMMEQLVDFPTHTKGNILDLLITNVPERIVEVVESGRLGRSDHVVIVTRVEMGGGDEEEKESAPDWRRADWDGMREELQDTSWSRDLARMTVEAAWQAFNDKVTNLVKKHVPERRRRNRNRPPWMSREILRAVRKKKKMWTRVRNSGVTAEYREQEKKVKNMIRTAKRKFEKKLAVGNDGNKRPFFAYVKQKTKSRSTVGPLKDGNGQTVSDTVDMADLLNSTFKSVFTRERTGSVSSNLEPDTVKRTQKELTTVKFKVKIVKRKIADLRADAAAGPDGIGPKILKELADCLAPALVTIYNKSMEEGAVPDGWREANVTPIFKKGAKCCPSNYRPVSLTSVCCKVMESVVRDSMTNHLTDNKLIGASQHGFVKGRSCATNLLEFLEKATTAVDRGEAFDVVYLDFAKAFDKVPHKRLLRKVRAHGITGEVLRWIESWLTNRKQRVVLNGKFSSWAEVLSGVPQGSVLGPLLFVIFINDIDEVVEKVEIIKKFADDTKIGQRMITHQDKQVLQEALDALCGWAKKWGMEFNVAKCKIMHLGNQNPMHQFTMEGQVLQQTKEERDIGVTVQHNLKPTAQCAKAAKTAQAVLGQICRAFHYRDRHVFVRLYKQYVRPHLEFATQVWSPWTAADKECLERVQRRAVRMVSGIAAKEYEGQLRELGMTTLEERRHQADMHMVHKIMHAESGLDPATWFERAETATHATRRAADLLNIKAKYGRLEVRRNFFTLRVISNWNNIPAELKSRRGAASFKAGYRRLREPPAHPAARLEASGRR
jgi:hypothetical protein